MICETITGIALTIAAVAGLIGFLTWADRRAEKDTEETRH